MLFVPDHMLRHAKQLVMKCKKYTFLILIELCKVLRQELAPSCKQMKN